VIEYLINKIKAWWYLDATIDAARSAVDEYNDLRDKYRRLQVAATKVVNDRKKPVGWPALQEDIRKLEAVLTSGL
jgi:hypothetical protein